MSDIPLKCSCGKVQGIATNITPQSGNHVVCCCSDCQKFARFLERKNEILDEFGGTEVYQTSQSQVKITQGNDQIRCMRHSPKGLYRWYTECCKTPIGNTLNGKMPFIGLVHNFIENPQQHATSLGPIRAFVQTQDAISKPDYPNSSEKFPLGITLRIIRKILLWKIRGMNKPSSFFDDSGRPRVKPLIPPK